jgi:hypothetical protein
MLCWACTRSHAVVSNAVSFCAAGYDSGGTFFNLGLA